MYLWKLKPIFSYINTPFYFPGISDEILMHDHGYAFSLMTNSLANISLNQEQLLSETDALSAEIRSLNVQLDELNVEVETLRSSRFSLEKIKDNDKAVKFYTGFPNYKALVATFQYFEPKLQHIHYWRGPKFVKTSGSYTTTKPGKKRSLSLLNIAS